MLRFFRIERPITATLRSTSAATSIACCMRWMFDANDVIRTRPVRCGMIWRKASPTTRSERVKPGPLGVRRVAHQQVDAAVPELGELADVGAQAVDRRVVELPVAGVEDPAGGGLDRDADARRAPSAPCARTRGGTGRGRSASPSGSISRSSVERWRPCSSSFEPIMPSVSRVAQTSFDPHLAQQVRQRADVILVGVREHDGQHLAALEVAEVGQHEVDAEVLVTREREARVDDEDLAGDLEDRHVLPDLAEAAERDHPQHRVRHRPKHTATEAASFVHRLWASLHRLCTNHPFGGGTKRPPRTRTTCMRTGKETASAAAGRGDAACAPPRAARGVASDDGSGSYQQPEPRQGSCGSRQLGLGRRHEREPARPRRRGRAG